MSRDLIAEWHHHEIHTQYPVQPARLIMGCPIWGDHYVNRFIDWCLPSIVTSSIALTVFGWELIIYTDAQSSEKLAAALNRHRVPGQIRELPQDVLDVMKMGGQSKYWLLTAIHNALVLEAGRRGAGFHMLVADIVYSDRYFERLIDLTRAHPSITQGGMTINFGNADPLLSRYRRSDGTLAVPAAALGQIGWENQVGEWKSWTMDGIDEPFAEMPNSHFIFWRSTNQVRIHCAHRSAVWISPQACSLQTGAFGGTLDSELPRYAGTQFYVPAARDQMAYVALDDDRGHPTPRTTFAAFKQALIKDHGGRPTDPGLVAAAHWAQFKTPCVVPAHAVNGFPSETEVELRFQRLMARLEESDVA